MADWHIDYDGMPRATCREPEGATVGMAVVEAHTKTLTGAHAAGLLERQFDPPPPDDFLRIYTEDGQNWLDLPVSVVERLLAGIGYRVE